MPTAQQIQMEIEECIVKLKRLDPSMDYLFLLIPFDHEMMTHLSPEQKTEIEKRTIRAAQDAFQKTTVEMNSQ
jgi:hypothetical protein